MMKKLFLLLAALPLCTWAAPAATFDTNNYIACGAHSLAAVLVAKDSIALKTPVEDILRHTYKLPNPLDVKLARIAVDAMNGGLSAKPEDAKDLQHFLTGVCYESGLAAKKPTLQKT